MPGEDEHRAEVPGPPGGVGGIPPTGLDGADSHPAPEGLRYLFEVTKAEIDTQFAIAERIDSKARGLFAITAAIFTAAQALALREDTLRNLGSDKTLLFAVAVTAGVLVGLALLATAWTMFVRKDRRLESGPLLGWLGELEHPGASEAGISAAIVQTYITLMHERQQHNIARAERLIYVQVLCGVAVVASVVELVVAVQGLT